MIARLFSLIIAVLVAWAAAPSLTTVMGWLPMRELADALTPKDVFSRSASTYVLCVVGRGVLRRAARRGSGAVGAEL